MTLAGCIAHETVHIPGIGAAAVIDPRRGRVRIVRVRTAAHEHAGALCCGITINLKPTTYVRRGGGVE